MYYTKGKGHNMRIQDLWPDDIKKAKLINTPKEILDCQAQFLEQKTGKILNAYTAEVDDSQDNCSINIKKFDFCFEFKIKSKYIENYTYTLFQLRHDIDLYPLSIRVDKAISRELGYDHEEIFVNNEEEFISRLSNILQTNRVYQVIINLISLSN